MYLTPLLKGFPLELSIGARVKKAPMMGYETVESFKIGLII